MKTLKLEIGKTYVNRKGEEVKIVVKNVGKYAYRGSDLERYTENGEYFYSGPEHPKDLIEDLAEPRYTSITPDDMKEVTSARYTFTIPDRTKGINVSKEGNRTVVEMVPKKGPKPGDVMVNKYGSVYIFKEDVGNDIHEHYARLGENGRLVIGAMCHPGRPATPEEAQPLFDALKKDEKRWNPEAMQVEEVPEREKIMDFLQRYGNNVKWSHEQLCWLIEAYLKHRS